MKITAAAMLLAMSLGAQANNSLCASLTLSFNTHPHRSCPELKAVCLTAYEQGDLEVQMADDTELTLPFEGYDIEHMSDVGSRIYQSYTLGGMPLSVNLNSDGEYPHPTRLPGIEGIDVWTKLQERSGVYSSQSCYYKAL